MTQIKLIKTKSKKTKSWITNRQNEQLQGTKNLKPKS